MKKEFNQRSRDAKVQDCLEWFPNFVLVYPEKDGLSLIIENEKEFEKNLLKIIKILLYL